MFATFSATMIGALALCSFVNFSMIFAFDLMVCFWLFLSVTNVSSLFTSPQSLIFVASKVIVMLVHSLAFSFLGSALMCLGRFTNVNVTGSFSLFAMANVADLLLLLVTSPKLTKSLFNLMSPFSIGYTFSIFWPLGVTVPLMVMTLRGALLLTVTVLVKAPGRPAVEYFTRIVPLPPGATGSRDHCGVVHPHEALTELRTSGSFPVFVNENTCDTEFDSSFTTPKSKVFSSNVISGLLSL